MDTPVEADSIPWQRADTDWFRDCRWGVFIHYLTGVATTADEWNRRVDAFDVSALADQLASVGAPYLGFTLGQNSGHYCAPNATYDRIVGIQPSKCSRRDLIADLSAALAPRGIRMLAYLPSGAPDQDAIAKERLHWQWGFSAGWGSKTTGLRLAEFQGLWESVIREWSLRWGRNVRGWWIDGCYFAEDMYRFPEPPNFRSFAQALKAGNPDSIVAFNPGVKVPVICHSEFEDYTAGELSGDLPIGAFGLSDNPAFCNFGPIKRWVNGAQFHVLNFLGPWWSQSPPRLPTDLVVGYTRHVNACDGVVTWDVPTSPTGRIPEPFMEQLRALGQAARRR